GGPGEGCSGVGDRGGEGGCWRRVRTWHADEIARHRLRRAAMPAALAVVLAAGLDAANKTLTREHDAVGNDLALRNGGPQPPGRADEHSPGGRLAQPAT